jgi:hypothetical protein
MLTAAASGVDSITLRSGYISNNPSKQCASAAYHQPLIHSQLRPLAERTGVVDSLGYASLIMPTTTITTLSQIRAVVCVRSSMQRPPPSAFKAGHSLLTSPAGGMIWEPSPVQLSVAPGWMHSEGRP